MAEISLSAYQDEIERLLRDERYAEAITHGRHILKSRPKDLRAYRQLGDALIASGRWDEAAGLLRRALGAQPQDFHIHSQLARAYQGLADFERAIWHAERALDQQPSDRQTISLIRELYRAHRHEEIDRLQLTAGALAQQQIRGNLLTAALDTLAKALERSPKRVDLQLLRARALWLDGQRMEAAETALDVLDRLPYAIDANRIMTELWLAEQRPSDAQTYLKRIEDLDPALAHQMASADEAPASLVMLERLEYSGDAQRERDLVNPEWLDTLDAGRAEDGETSTDGVGGLGALFGIAAEDAEATPRAVTADLDALLSDEQIEQLFSELVIGEPVAAVSAAQPAEDEAEEALATLEAQGYIEPSASAEPHTIAAPRIDAAFAELGELDAQPSTTDEEDAAADADSDADMNGELADLLEKLDSGEEDGDWMADIQQASLDLDADEDAQAYLDDFEREWVKAGREEDAAGAPWLSAAMREAMDQEDDGALNLFGEDEQMQNLLNSASDTEPLRLSDIENWLSAEPDAPAAGADEPLLDFDDELLQAPPARSWLEDDDEAGPSILSAADDEDPNQLNAQLIDDWGAELGDDDDDDPYVDWLKDDPAELDDELSGLSARVEDEAAAPNGDSASAAQRARAWGLDDADQLADFVEAARGDDSAPDWLNAVVPGLDRENDAATDDANEYARPMSSPGKEFAWLRELVEDETGEMRAIDPDDEIETPYFRFSKPPAWLTAMKDRSAISSNEPIIASAAALSLDEDIEALDLDDLTFDDYFSFDTPTDKLDAINLDEDTQRLSFAGLDWDDYFDLESPTKKTIAITLDEDAAELEFDPLGVDDVDFDFEKPPQNREADRAGIDFDDIDLGDELIAQADQEAQAPPTWLNYDGSTDDDRDADDPGRRSGQTTL